MNAHATDPHFSFQLPSLSYVDAKWEEPELRGGAKATLPTRKAGFTAWLIGRVAAFRAWRQDNVAILELDGMSDHELLDIGISRSDLRRLFDPAFNEELRRRGTEA